MKKLIALVLILTSLKVIADTNVLELVWSQPPNYTSQLFTATNLTGTWTPLVLSSNQPPVFIQETNQQAFFYVVVTPPQNMAGSGDPILDVPAGVTYVNTNSGDFWVNVRGGTNGWVEEIAGF